MTKPCVGARAQQQQWTHRDRGSLDTRSWKTHNDMHIYSPLWHQRIIRVLFSGKRENMLIQGNKACHSGHKHAAGNTSVSCLPPFRNNNSKNTHLSSIYLQRVFCFHGGKTRVCTTRSQSVMEPARFRERWAQNTQWNVTCGRFLQENVTDLKR